MLSRGGEFDPARAIGQIDASLLEQRGGDRQRLVFDGQDIVAPGCALDAQRRRLCRAHRAKQRNAARTRRGWRRRRLFRLAWRNHDAVENLDRGFALDGDEARIAGDFVDYVEPHRDPRSVLAEPALKPDRGPNRAVAQRLGEHLAQPGAIGEPVGHDCDQAAAGRQAAERGLQVANRGKVIMAATERA